MKRLPAFTLMEVILSLFLTALLGSFAFSILQYLQQSSIDLGSSSIEHQELLFLNVAIRTDMEQASKIYELYDGGLEMHTASGPIVYELIDDGIRRTKADGTIDLFKVPIRSMVSSTISPQIPLVHLWKLIIGDPEKPRFASFHKMYSTADRILEHDLHAGTDPR
ncbi:MAG: hypothetical protein M3R08_08625 [Bacteroidota bacterium]|nr:hypothetical protein [Bacteroidota bacterium]